MMADTGNSKEKPQSNAQQQQQQQQKREPSVPPKYHDPRKIRTGKNANIYRDMVVFISILSIMFYFTLPSRDTNQKDGDNATKKKPSTTKRVKDLLHSTYQDIMESRRKEPCSIFITQSTVSSSLSLFAGRNYSVGERIIVSSKDAMTLLEINRVLSSPLSISDRHESLTLSPYALMLPHHPTMSNVRGSLLMLPGDIDDTMSTVNPELALYATRNIHEAEELFVEFHDVLHGIPWFIHSIPTVSDYQTAGEITKRARVAGIAIHNANQRRHIIGPIKGINRIFGTIKSIVSDQDLVSSMNARVAYLLPDSLTAAKQCQDDDPYRGLLRNTTLLQLQRKCTCLDDIVITVNSEESRNQRRVCRWNNKAASKGTVLLQTPVYIMPVLNHKECPVHCFHYSDASSSTNLDAAGDFALCPLLVSLGNILSIRKSGSTDEDDQNNNDNVEFRWSSETLLRQGLSTLDLTNSNMMDRSLLTWDLVATKNLERGDELQLHGFIDRSLPQSLRLRQ